MTVMTVAWVPKERVLYRERPKKGLKTKKVAERVRKVGKCGLTLTQKGNLFREDFFSLRVLRQLSQRGAALL
jgi:hypothetical protein